jgi:hypothetical protein
VVLAQGAEGRGGVVAFVDGQRAAPAQAQPGPAEVLTDQRGGWMTWVVRRRRSPSALGVSQCRTVSARSARTRGWPTLRVRLMPAGSGSVGRRPLGRRQVGRRSAGGSVGRRPVGRRSAGGSVGRRSVGGVLVGPAWVLVVCPDWVVDVRERWALRPRPRVLRRRSRGTATTGRRATEPRGVCCAASSTTNPQAQLVEVLYRSESSAATSSCSFISSGGRSPKVSIHQSLDMPSDSFKANSPAK